MLNAFELENEIRRDALTLSADKDIATALASDGYYCFKDSLPSRNWFLSLYRRYDALMDLVEQKPQVLEEWKKAVDSWYADRSNAVFYSRIPPVLKDRSGQTGKRDKSYVQFILEFALSDAFAASPLAGYSEITQLFDQFRFLHFACAKMFHRALVGITDGDDLSRARLVPEKRLSPIVFKLLRYNPNPMRFGSGPHYDKSAVSLLLHADDREVSYRVTHFRDELVRYSQMYAPLSYPNSDDAPNHALLLSGVGLRELGLINFPATPHSVLPILKGTARHSIVAFYIVPSLELNSALTKVNWINDVYPNVT